MAYNPNNTNGQKTMANSAPVVVASDQSAVPVSATALPLPTGAATAALQTTGNTSLSTITTNTTKPTLVSERVSDTGGTSTALTNFGATASNYNYIYAFSVFRTDAGTTPIYLDFRDGTAGSILYSVVIPPSGGAVMANDWQSPLFRTSVNTALAIDMSAATTSVFVSISGYKSTV